MEMCRSHCATSCDLDPKPKIQQHHSFQHTQKPWKRHKDHPNRDTGSREMLNFDFEWQHNTHTLLIQ